MAAELPREGDLVVLRTPNGLRFAIVRGAPEGDEAEVLGAAIDRMAAWDRGQEPGPWVTSTRPGIGVGAYPPGSRWSHSVRSTWGRDR